ncbi:MAG: hypothetical protein IE884_01130 [Sulfuricurvum sp.]|nr:hypothetical protein [Sulfuricurvum sp.]
MHIVKYLFLFAFVFLIFKAFLLDDYLAKRSTDNNETAVVEEVNASTVTVEKPEKPKSATSSNAKEGMPIDQLGDKIADKLGDKL